MPKLTIEIEYDEGDLEKSIQFLHKNPEATPYIMQDYFADGVLKVDMNQIEDKDVRFYHFNGLTALCITLKDTQHVTA